MDLTSITNIRDLKNKLKEQISQIDKSRFPDSNFGSENEYSYRGMLGGIDCLLTDITTLTKSPSQFLKLSTYQERIAILNSLKNIEVSLNSPSQLLQYLDGLKIALRPFHIRYTKDRLLDFDEEISGVVRKKQVLEEEIVNLKEKKEENEGLLSELVKNNERLTELLSELETLQSNTTDKNIIANQRIISLDERVTECEELIEKASEIVESTSEYLNTAKTSTSTIKEFEDTVDKRLKQVEIIDARTKEYRKNIEDFENEREGLNKKAKDTIEEALKALEYNTARGLSASFQAQLEKIEGSKFHRWLWGSGIFLVLTLGIGVWIVLTGHGDLNATIGKLALTPFTITGAVFCANQFIRNKNIIDDYSYKMVLSKSIVGFSEQLNNIHESSDEYKNYILMALAEIHKDPLRKRSKDDKDVDGGLKSSVGIVFDTAEKIIELTKPK